MFKELAHILCHLKKFLLATKLWWASLYSLRWWYLPFHIDEKSCYKKVRPCGYIKMFSFTITAKGYIPPLLIESKLDTLFLCDLLRWSFNQRITWCSRICRNVSNLNVKEINNSIYTFSGIYEKYTFLVTKIQ